MPSEQEIQNEIQLLINQIEKHNRLYYQEASPEISDLEYDALFDRLKKLEETYPHLSSPHSPIKKVGSDTDTRFAEVRHKIPVLSLDKVYTPEELSGWMAKTVQKAGHALSFTLEPKIDGFSVVLYYEKGKLMRAVSRGNGETGNDLTSNILTLKGIPLTLSKPLNLAVRGEVYLARNDFMRHNEEMGNIYANPRNFAAGTIRRINPAEVEKIPLKIFFYDGYCEEGVFSSAFETLEFLKENGFSLAPDTILVSDRPETLSFESIPSYLESMTRKRKSLEYEIDGLVMKVNEFSAREELGYTSHHPRWAVAFKFESPQNQSRVLGIEIQVGRTGKITPLALLEPVSIGGTTVSRAILHNQDYINQLELGLGDGVLVSKRGEIIPAVEKVTEKTPSPVYQIPPQCPECGSLIEKKGAHLFCLNETCPARIRERLSYFVQILEIDGIGKETVKTLLEKKLIQSPADFYALKEESLTALEGFGVKKASLMLKGLKDSLKNPFSKLLAALGLSEIGPKVIEILMNHGFDSLTKIKEAAQKNDSAVFTGLFGLGEGTAAALIRHFSHEPTLKELEDLGRAGFSLQEALKTEVIQGKLSGTFWVITGSFEHFKPREKAAEKIEALGGKVLDSVSKAATHLLAGDKAGSKLLKAQKLGMKILSETEFLILIQEKGEEASENLF